MMFHTNIFYALALVEFDNILFAWIEVFELLQLQATQPTRVEPDANGVWNHLPCKVDLNARVDGCDSRIPRDYHWTVHKLGIVHG